MRANNDEKGHGAGEGAFLPDALRVIGVIRGARTDPFHTPVQADLNRRETAAVAVAEAYAEGLDGLAEFDYVWLLTWLGEGGEPALATPALRQVPFLRRSQSEPIGIFATRGPRRINPIGLSLVRLLGVDGTDVHFAGVDVVDGTPVIDIKRTWRRSIFPRHASRRLV